MSQAQHTARKQDKAQLLKDLYAAQDSRDSAAEQSGILRVAYDAAVARNDRRENSVSDVSRAQQTYLNQKAYLEACQERVDQLKETINAL